MIKYTISELADETNVTKRSVRFYVSEKLLDGPEGEGGGARYGEKHLLQLLLIKKLQESMKISGIKVEMESIKKMPVEQLRAMVEGKEYPSNVKSSEDLNNFLIAQTQENMEKSDTRTIVEGYLSRIRKAEAAQVASWQQHKSWQRIELDEGIELNIRADRSSIRLKDLICLLKQSWKSK